MSDIKISKTTEINTTTNYLLKMTGKEIIDALNRLPVHPDGRPSVKIPLHANVQINVPTGGDYSGLELDIDEDMPINIWWTSKVGECYTEKE